MRNSGKILILPDGRKVIMYDEQPIVNKIILHLIDDEGNILLIDGKPRTLLRPINDFYDRIDDYKLIGYID